MKDPGIPPGHAYYPLLVEEQPGEWTPTGQLMVGENHSAAEVALRYREEHPDDRKMRVAVMVPPEGT
jgi:hypothetical protein